MAVYKRGGTYWFKFNWDGETIRESAKTGNKRVAEGIEAARRTQLAKGEVGIRDKAPVPTVAEFAEKEFVPYCKARFQQKPRTLQYYMDGLRHLKAFAPIASARLDAVTADAISQFTAKQQESEFAVSSLNRQLQVLRRMLKLALEWERIEKSPARVRMQPGERRRERVLSPAEETRYLQAAQTIGDDIIADYEAALQGIRATQRGEEPICPRDPYLLRDVATVLIECGLRPDECFRLEWAQVRDGTLHLAHGKTENARRIVPLSEKVAGILDVRRTAALDPVWVFPAPTKSGHIEQSTLKKRHSSACKFAELEQLPLYTFRHSCLTRWATAMDPYTLAYCAGHSDFATTKRYVHPQQATVLAAMQKARVAAPIAAGATTEAQTATIN